MRLNLKAVEERVAPLGGRESYDREFIFDLLLAYGKPQGNVTRLRKGSLNVADDPETEVAQKNVVYFKETTADPLAVIDELKTSPTVVRYKTRFVIVTDYTELLAVDTKTGENLMIPIGNIAEHFTFFLPWAGMEKAQYTAEAHADVKAAERMGKLFDELLAANPDLLDDPQGRHGLNVFFTRLLFCFFAEDTGIFEESQFTNAVGSHTQPDGSDVAEFLSDLFRALDTQEPTDKPTYLAGFPYVNGRLFTMKSQDFVPRFTRQARQHLIESGSLIWREINPDIFGSMFQAIVAPGKRSDLGQHYTSVPNILKTIEPLFLDDLKEKLDAGFDSPKKLEQLLDRISAIKVFDPACGSGNFLVIAYKELRKLEHAILERLAELDPNQVLFNQSKINIENFYGIEIDDFAVEVAILSLWIAKHQMNTEFKEKFNVSIPLIPLKETGQIHAGNATRIDWNEVCPNLGNQEIYLIGNPPYLGSRHQTTKHKNDLAALTPRYKSLDYVTAWLIKGADYIRRTAAQLAFVTTNSVTQGEQVSLIWPSVLGDTLEIGYAYTSFRWQNNAKNSAGVTCVVLSLRNIEKSQKSIFTNEIRTLAQRINPYLADASTIWLSRRSSPLSIQMPRLGFGSMPNDGGHLILSGDEVSTLLQQCAGIEKYIRGFMGSEELLNDKQRWCLWIEDFLVEEARRIPPIASRLEQVRAHRTKSTEKSTRAKADTPHKFYYSAHQPGEAIIVPAVSSENREYIPIGYTTDANIANNRVYVAYNTEPWIFAILSSRMHMTWVNAVAGRLETRFNYSNTIVYNNFPVPMLSDTMKADLTQRALRILDAREYHCERTLAELYDPALMPADLRAAHAEVDALVDSIYSKGGYETDEQRLSDLFAMYEAMIAEEAAKAPAKKTRGTKK